MEFRADYVPYERKELAEVPAETLAIRNREAREEEGFFLSGEEGPTHRERTAENGFYCGEREANAERRKGKGRKQKPDKTISRRNMATKKGNYRGEKREFTRKLRRSDNPDVLYGRDFEDNFIPISEITEVVGEVTIRGKVFELDVRYIEKSGSTLFIFSVTDFTDSITAKLFVRGEGEELDRLKSEIKVGSFLKLRGATTIDNRDGELILGSVNGMKKSESFEESKREDHAREKRVELHCHTKMSDLDAVNSAKDIIKQVKNWGMEAVAITDHGNLQAFPEAWHAVSGDLQKNPKIIYGVEGYFGR